MTHMRCFAPFLFATSLVAASNDVRLLDAAKNSDKTTIQYLLAQHVDLSAADKD
jgi:hypothetical protein